MLSFSQFNHYLISRIKNRHLKNNLNQDWKKSYRKRFFEKTQSFNLTDYKTAIRFETEPGVQAQVDWGHFGKIVGIEGESYRIKDKLKKNVEFSQ